MYCTSNNPAFFSVNRSPLRHRFNRFLKRALDLCLTWPAFLVLMPLFALLCLLIWLEDKGSAFYTQARITCGDKVFLMYKFRTMHAASESDSGPVWASKNDRRTTRTGQFLRRSSLDELPQLWNVIKGDMSLIGPRPERPFFVEKFTLEIPGYAQRHQVKTGLTGWAQIHGLRGDTSLEERVKHDLYYIENWSFFMDISILYRSFGTVIRDYINKQAY